MVVVGGRGGHLNPGRSTSILLHFHWGEMVFFFLYSVFIIYILDGNQHILFWRSGVCDRDVPPRTGPGQEADGYAKFEQAQLYDLSCIHCVYVD